MTYDVQRYSAYHSGDPHKIGLWEDKEGAWVLAADAEAHERIAVQEAYERRLAAVRHAEKSGYEEALRDCVESIRSLTNHNVMISIDASAWLLRSSVLKSIGELFENLDKDDKPTIKRNWFFYHDSPNCPQYCQQDYVSCAICDPEQERMHDE